jgi:hypothetical protein
VEKVSKERIARYRKLGQRSALDLKNRELGEFFRRAELEGCQMFHYPFNLQGKESAFHLTAVCPTSPAPVMGLKQCVAGHTCRAPCII